MTTEHEHSWTTKMKPSPFTKRHFTAELQQQVLSRTRATAGSTGHTSITRVRRIWMIAGASLSLLVIATWLFSLAGPAALPPSGVIGGRDVPTAPLSDRTEYYENGKLKLAIYPDPYLSAGRISGYIFHFTAPFGEFKDHKLSIRAEHSEATETGEVKTYVTIADEIITEPSSGYTSLERYTASAAVPLPGKWRYIVELDGNFYGDAELTVGESSWSTSPLFKSGSYMLRGIEGKVGFIDAGFTAGASQKYMWHLWEDSNMYLYGEFMVKAVKEGDNKIINIFSSDLLGGALNGADRTVISMMSLPEKGKWRLLPYVGDRLLGSIVVEVKDGS